MCCVQLKSVSRIFFGLKQSFLAKEEPYSGSCVCVSNFGFQNVKILKFENCFSKVSGSVCSGLEASSIEINQNHPAKMPLLLLRSRAAGVALRLLALIGVLIILLFF